MLETAINQSKDIDIFFENLSAPDTLYSPTTTTNTSAKFHANALSPSSMMSHYQHNEANNDNNNNYWHVQMMETIMLSLAYMLLFIPFLLCWNAVVRSLRRREYLSSAQADTLVECAEESVRDRIEHIKLSNIPPVRSDKY